MKIDATSKTLRKMITALDLVERYMVNNVPTEPDSTSEDSLNAHVLVLYRVRDALDGWARCAEFEDWAPKLKKGDVDEITGLTYDPKLTVIE